MLGGGLPLDFTSPIQGAKRRRRRRGRYCPKEDIPQLFSTCSPQYCLVITPLLTIVTVDVIQDKDRLCLPQNNPGKRHEQEQNSKAFSHSNFSDASGRCLPNGTAISLCPTTTVTHTHAHLHSILLVPLSHAFYLLP